MLFKLWSADEFTSVAFKQMSTAQKYSYGWVTHWFIYRWDKKLILVSFLISQGKNNSASFWVRYVWQRVTATYCWNLRGSAVSVARELLQEAVSGSNGYRFKERKFIFRVIWVWIRCINAFPIQISSKNEPNFQTKNLNQFCAPLIYRNFSV